VRSDAKFTQSGSEAAAVNQAETESQQPAAFGFSAAQDILQSDVDDGGGNKRLDKSRRRRNGTKRGKRQGDGMGNGKTGDDLERGTQAISDHQESECD